MANTARFFVRPLSYENKDLAVAKEIVADYKNNMLYIVNEDGSIHPVSDTSGIEDYIKENQDVITNVEITLESGEVITIQNAIEECLKAIDNFKDEKVSQNVTHEDAEFPLLLAPEFQTSDITSEVYFASEVTLNALTNTIKCNISGNAESANKDSNGNPITDYLTLTGARQDAYNDGTGVVYTKYDIMDGNGVKKLSVINDESSVGTDVNPVYMKNGFPKACKYYLRKSVPADAVFTDTTYDVATETTDGLMSSEDKVAIGNMKTTVDSMSEELVKIEEQIMFANATSLMGYPIEVHGDGISEWEAAGLNLLEIDGSTQFIFTGTLFSIKTGSSAYKDPAFSTWDYISGTNNTLTYQADDNTVTITNCTANTSYRTTSTINFGSYLDTGFTKAIILIQGPGITTIATSMDDTTSYSTSAAVLLMNSANSVAAQFNFKPDYQSSPEYYSAEIDLETYNGVYLLQLALSVYTYSSTMAKSSKVKMAIVFV